jgi:hypothetical protein
MAGIDSRNEKRAAVSRLTPRNRPAEMVMPERLVPGISASAWPSPIPAALSTGSRCSSRCASSASVAVPVARPWWRCTLVPARAAGTSSAPPSSSPGATAGAAPGGRERAYSSAAIMITVVSTSQTEARRGRAVCSSAQSWSRNPTTAAGTEARASSPSSRRRVAASPGPRRPGATRQSTNAHRSLAK